MTKPKQPHYSLRSFGSFMARYKWRFAVVLFSFILSNTLLAIIPIFIGKLIGALTASPINQHQAFVYVGLLIACSVGHASTTRLSEYLYLKLIRPVGFLYETTVFKRVIRQPYPYFVDKFTGKISAYIDTLGEEARTFIDNLCYDYVDGAVRLIVVGVILTTVNWYSGAIFALSIVLMFIIGKHTIRNNTKYEKVSADVQSTKSGKIVDAISNFVNVKSFQSEQAEIATVETEQTKTIAAANKAFAWEIYFWASISFLVRVLLWSTTIILNVYLFLHHQLSLAELTTFLSAIVLFSDFIWEIVWNVWRFNMKLAHVEEAHRYLFGKTNIAREELSEAISVPEKREFNRSFNLQQLSFAYPDKNDVEVLSDITIDIKKNEKIGIVGKSGSGKTTLTKLLLGYYPLQGGELTIDGEPITTEDVSRMIAYVPQDTTLFHRSIAENIAYAAEGNVSREAVIRAAQQAHAEEFITQISDGYDAVVGERGVKLSSGQRQRIAIARALLVDKPILILDEATSALDSESEVLVQQALEALWHDKTVIAIAHRLSTLRHMDRIVVFEKGKIIEQGTHTELLAHKGKYAELWAHQSGGFLEE